MSPWAHLRCYVAWLRELLYAHIRGYIVALGLMVSVTLTVMAGVWTAQRSWVMGGCSLIIGVLVLKPTLMYLTAWVAQRIARKRDSAGPSDSPSEG